MGFQMVLVFIASFLWTVESSTSIVVGEHENAELFCRHYENIEVISAKYFYGSDHEFHTDTVNRHCCAKSTCSVPAENDFFGGDPSYGNIKSLKIDYYCIKAPPNFKNCKTWSCTRSSNVKCTKCKDQLLFKLFDGQCIDKCSWNNRLCWPGNCTNEYAKDCHCDKDFSLRSQASETSCQPTKSPTLFTCRMTVHDDDGEVRYSPTIGKTDCKNQQDFYGKFEITYVTVQMESEYEINSTSTRPSFVQSHILGVTGAIISVQRKNLTDPAPSEITNKVLKEYDSLQPVPLLNGNASFELNEPLFDGDRICVDFQVKGGGFVISKDLRTSPHDTSEHLYSLTSTNKEICYYYDTSAPVHLSQTRGSKDEPLNVSERISESRHIFVSTSNWEDPYPKGGSSKQASGISSMDITVNEMVSTGDILSRGKKVLSVNLNTTATLQIPESETPILYEILLEVKDVADNVRKARRFFLFDNSSYIEINQNSPLRSSSASPQTNYLWQTKLQDVCFSWTGRYLNRYHINGQYLDKIKNDDDICGHYDQVTGLLPVNGTRNVNGITDYSFTLFRNNNAVKQDIVHNFTKEAICIDLELSDGDELLFEITAMDIVKHTKVENTSLLIDSTLPEIDDLYLEKNGVKRLFVHSEKDFSTMNLHFEAFDVHSGIHDIKWFLRASDSSIWLGKGAISIIRLPKNEACPSSSFCYCPKQGSCEFSNHTIDFNLLVANNTHIGNHNRRYIVSLIVRNNALLSNTEHMDILVDDSAPEKGVVKEGPKGGPDIDYTDDNSTIIHWDGFVDHESGIMKYFIAIGPNCLTQRNLIFKNVLDEFYVSETIYEEIRLPLKNSGKNYVTMIAFNNALEPSDSVCSDGITWDRSVPTISNVTIHLAKINESIACLEEEAWMITAHLKRIRLSKRNLVCASTCKGKQDTEYVSLLPVLIEHYPEDKAAFLCSFLPFNNNTLIYIPDDTIHVDWNIDKGLSQVNKVYIGYGSHNSLYQNPDLLPYEKVDHPGRYTKHHTMFSNGEIFYLFLKMMSKTGVFATAVIGPFIIDETAPICPALLPVEIEKDKVLVKWNSSTFIDTEQKEQIDLILFIVVSEKGTKTPIHEWRLHNSSHFCVTTQENCLSYPIFKLQALDSQAGLYFYFHIQVFNKAGHSCHLKSESFKIPSNFGPGIATVIDVFSSNTSKTESVDTDISFEMSKFCIRYSGLRAHGNITLSLGLGTIKLSDDVLPFQNLEYNKPSKPYCIGNVRLRKRIRYFATLKASCTEGLSFSSSDGFYAVDDEFIRDSLTIYDGLPCSKINKRIYGQYDSQGIVKFAEKLHVGKVYSLGHDIKMNITSSNVLIQSSTENNIIFIPMTENPTFYISSAPKNISLFDLYTCAQNGRFFTSQVRVSFFWTLSTFIQNFLSHMVVGVQKKNRNQTYDELLQFTVKKTNSFKLSKKLHPGDYRGYVIPCFGPICHPNIYLSNFTVVARKPTPGHLECRVTFNTANNIVVLGQIDSFTCSSANDEMLFYRYGLFKDETGKVVLEEKHIITASIEKTLKIRYPFKGKLSPFQRMYFCTEGFCRSSLSSKSCVRVYTDVKYNLFDKAFVFEYDKSRQGNSIKAVSTLRSSDFSEKLAFIESLDVDFVRSDITITGVVFPSTIEQRTWFLMKERRMPSTDCRDDIACIQSKSVPDPEISFNLKTVYTRIFYLCVGDLEKVNNGFVNSTLDPQTVGTCSDGFKIDNDKPISGNVTISSENGFVTALSDMFVVWEGFQDPDSSSGDGYFRNHISYYEIAIGSHPNKQDVLPFTNAGSTTNFHIQDINLTTGLAYYATIKAYDMAGNVETAFSPGVTVDDTPPTRGVIYVGGPSWHKKLIGGDTLEVHWDGFEDYESGIAQFEVAIGTTPYLDDVVTYTDILDKTSTILSMNQPRTGENYFVTLIATNMAGLFTVAHSEAFVFDNTPPILGVVRDGPLRNNHDLDFQENSTSVSVHWLFFSDSESGISYYRVGLGLSPERSDVFSLHYVGNETSWTWTGSFIQGCKYYALVEACNGAFLCTTMSSNGIIIDDSPPILGLVRIGNSDHTSKYIPKRTSVMAKWIGFHDPQSGIRDFEVCIGSNATACDIMSLTNVLLSESFIATGLILPVMKPLFFIVRTNNHVGMSSLTSSDSFVVDDTSPFILESPRFTNCQDKNEIHYHIDVSRLCIDWNITDEESAIISQLVQYRTHDDGHVPVKHSVLGSFQTFQLILNPTDWLLSGDTYTVTVTACNSAGLCTSSESGQLTIDSTPPLVGGFMQPMSWSCTNMVCTIDVTWFGFSDVESGIKNYIISVGKTYSGVELKDAYLVYAKEDENGFQNTSVNLEDSFNLNEKIVLSISAINKAGLRSSTAKVSVEAKGSRDKLGSRGSLVIEKHSCDIHYCNNDCTCAAFGKKCEPEKHFPCQNVSTSFGSTLEIFIHNTIYYKEKQVLLPGSCVKTVWNHTDDALRYEWSIGIEDMQEGDGIFDSTIEPVWYDVGLNTNVTYCTKQEYPFEHGYSYVFYVRKWISQTTYAQHASEAMFTDNTPPLVRKGKFLMESTEDCSIDLKFSANKTTLTACWRSVFSDQQSGIQNYFVLLGTNPEGDDVIKIENVGLSEKRIWTGLSLDQGTKYFVTVIAVNNVGLSSSSYSDGVVIDFEKPVEGIVFNTISHRNIRAQSAHKIIGSSWYGFNDRHSFIRDYLVTIIECNGQPNFTSVNYINVGLQTQHKFQGLSLKHNRKYCVAVKARDAAGFESKVSISTSLTIDKTPPSGKKCIEYQNTDFDLLEKKVLDKGLELIGSLSFFKDEFLRFKIDVINSTENEVIQISFFEKKLVFFPHATNDILSGEFEYLAEFSARTNVSIFVSNINDASFIQHNISECIHHGQLKYNTERSIDSVQMSPHTVGIRLNIKDSESDIRNVSLSIGTTFGGNQVYEMSAVGLERFFTLTTDVPHLTPIYTSVMVENVAGLRFYDYSDAIIMDHTAPDICCGEIDLSYKEMHNVTMTRIAMKWTAIDDESGVDFCTLTLGSVTGTSDILQGQLISGSRSWYQTKYLFLGHGDKVHATIRCTNRVRMSTMHHIEPAVVSIQPPNVRDAHAIFVGNRGQIDNVASESGTNLTILWDGINDPSGLTGYQCLLPGDPLGRWRNSGMRTSYTIPLDQAEEGNMIFTEIRAINVGGLSSATYRRVLNVTFRRPQLSGFQCAVEKLSGSKCKVSWDNVFVKEMDLTYTVNVGSAEGMADLIEDMRSTDTHIVFYIEETDKLFIAIEAQSDAGLNCYYRKTLKIAF